ncbi:MAG: Smr/MutS family protein [Novosphingobium sp.]
MRRKLSSEEAALWARVAATVEPLEGRPHPLQSGEGGQPKVAGVAPAGRRNRATNGQTAGSRPPPLRSGSAPQTGEQRRPLGQLGLDATWDRKLTRGIVQPDFTLDLHGCTLDAAHSRLDHGLTQALAQGARVVLLITGRLRAEGEHAGRGERRGAIRAKFLDWLEAGPHAGRIAAIHPAHPRHGGAGAVYIVLRKPR